jgi:hypothetical protein
MLLLAAEARSTCGGFVGITRWAQTVARHGTFAALGTRLGACPVALVYALHPHLAGRREGIEHLAHLVLRAGGTLAVHAVHLHAGGGSLLEPDAVLSGGATPGRTRGQAEGLGHDIGAEEILWTGARHLLLARTDTPTLTTATQQPRRTSLVGPVGIFVALLAVHARALQDTDTHPRTIVGQIHVAADAPVLAV